MLSTIRPGMCPIRKSTLFHSDASKPRLTTRESFNSVCGMSFEGKQPDHGPHVGVFKRLAVGHAIHYSQFYSSTRDNSP